ncbi:hypothetical protein C463_13844 [Halorubrum californiense DSM 19288]|uniref:Antitoxin n=1 Tax=Halorubrum californiense DSM 19288 TaxID=1227465 RepID=M0E310_9EURY|nr:MULTISPECIES: antitoxin VapB family protein [Halorubrum]ELZ41332.1 hypothetical protein C463_13844 [Halorubrum californiense DSM 19288]TKX67511.1 hypothetical protein EXE40_14920 [Halorubrum sp. GN11GM_10-3_MGM]
MPTKTIGVREEVYERLRARKRDDESFTDLIDRLIDESEGDWRGGFGSLSAAEADSLRGAAAASRERFDESAGDRQAAAIDRLGGTVDEAPSDDGANTDDADDSADATDDGTNHDSGGSA